MQRTSLNPHGSEANVATPAINPSDLCITCGLCCDGTLFDWGPIKDDEFEQVVHLGMTKKDDTNRERFSLPCPQLDGTKCACYGDRRPAICGDFMCELTSTLTSGQMNLAETQHVVARTREISDRVRAQLSELTGGGPELSIHELTVLLLGIMKLSEDQRGFRRTNAALFLGLASLHVTLGAHFMSKDPEDGRSLWSLPGELEASPS